MHDLSRAPESAGLTIVTPPDLFGGVWANAVQVQRTDHELTLDFIRVGPQGDQAIVTSRVNVSPLLLDQLVDALKRQQAA